MDVRKKIFIDTNILLYAHDNKEFKKRDKAIEIIEYFWKSKKYPFISVQVLQEFHANIGRKCPIDEAIEMTERFFRWNVIQNSLRILKRAFKVQNRYNISFWDANIIASAQYAGAEELWSEDLQDGQDFDGVKIFNPFIGSNPTKG